MLKKPKPSQRRRIDPDRRGYDTGRKARAKGLPEPRHVDINGNPRSSGWIEWMQKGYYRGGTAPQAGSKITVRSTIDLDLRNKAIDQGIERSAALEMALRILTSGDIDKLLEVFSDEIAAVIKDKNSVTLLDNRGVCYSAKTELEAAIAFLVEDN
jgi:hypothetical protein